MNNLIKRIISAIEGSGLKSVSVLMNGETLKNSGKMIYASVNVNGDKRSLMLFRRGYDNPTSSTNKAQFEYLSNAQILAILERMQSNELFGFKVGEKQFLDNCSVSVDAENVTLVMKSELYQIAEQLSGNIGRVSFKYHNEVVSANDAEQLKQLFLNSSLLNYRELVYAKGANQFVRRLMRKNKFYGIRPESFVPVFIEVNGIYNPLTNPILDVKSTAMYKLAVEKNRKVTASGVSAYFLTHKEICQAFGIRHFVRFLPSIWFDMFVGVLQPGNAAFPNSNRVVLQWVGELEPPAPLSKKYTEEAFVTVVNAYHDRFGEELSNYTKRNALDVYVLQNYQKLRHVGPTALDEGVTPAKLCSYYCEAALR